MIQEKLEIEDVNIERAHRGGNTNNASPRTVVGVENGVPWSNKKNSKKHFYSNKIFKLKKSFQNFPIFQGLTYEINLIALGSLK